MRDEVERADRRRHAAGQRQSNCNGSAQPLGHGERDRRVDGDAVHLANQLDAAGVKIGRHQDRRHAAGQIGEGHGVEERKVGPPTRALRQQGESHRDKDQIREPRVEREIRPVHRESGEVDEQEQPAHQVAGIMAGLREPIAWAKTISERKSSDPWTCVDAGILARSCGTVRTAVTPGRIILSITVRPDPAPRS